MDECVTEDFEALRICFRGKQYVVDQSGDRNHDQRIHPQRGEHRTLAMHVTGEECQDDCHDDVADVREVGEEVDDPTQRPFNARWVISVGEWLDVGVWVDVENIEHEAQGNGEPGDTCREGVDAALGHGLHCRAERVRRAPLEIAIFMVIFLP